MLRLASMTRNITGEKGFAAKKDDAFRGRTALRGANHGSAEEGKVRGRAMLLGDSGRVIVISAWCHRDLYQLSMMFS